MVWGILFLLVLLMVLLSKVMDPDTALTVVLALVLLWLFAA